MATKAQPATTQSPVTGEVPAHGAEEATPSAANGAAASLRGLAPYLVAGLIYVGIGMNDPRFMLNWSFSLVLLLVVVWAIPAALRRWLR